MVGSWRLDIRHNELKWSDENYRIFGVAPGTPMNYEAFLACVHPDDRAFVDREWTAALRGQPYDIEHRIVADGVVKWVREKADLEFDERHVLVGGIGITQDVTERRRREEALREAQERTELAMRGADLGTWDWNIPTGEVVFNARWAEMRGFRLNEIETRVDTWIRGVHPEDWPRVKRALDDYFEGRVPEYEAEHRVRTRSGDWIWILDRGKIFARDKEGRPTRMVGTELDITPRKRAEEELRLAEAMSSGILSISADAIISVDTDQRITMFNEGAEKIFAYGRAEAIGQPLDILIPERFHALHREHLARFAGGAETARRMGDRLAEIVGRRKNGEEFPAEAAISRLAVGGRTIMTVALRDITERRRIERQQNLLADLGAIFAASLDYEQTLATVGELIVHELADFCIVDLVTEGGERSRLKVAYADSRHASVCAELERLRLDPHRRHLVTPVLETKRPFLLEKVTPESVAEFVQSPEHLRLRRAMETRSLLEVPLVAHERLVGALLLISSKPTRTYTTADVPFVESIAERAALAIENGRLYREAVHATQLRDEVLGVVAHDLRNPLSSILMLARPREAEGAPGDEPFERIRRAAVRMNRLIRDLLDISTIDAGHLGLDRARLSARKLVAEAVEAQRPLADSASIDLRLEVSAELPEIWADSHRLLQVLENLLGNAMKFTPPDGHITVGALPREGEVLFWVADTGSGIARDALPHVFDRFWQAHRGDRKGAGLGLPITRGIVEAHGGRIWVESTLGQGATFFFTIPRSGAIEAEARPLPH